MELIEKKYKIAVAALDNLKGAIDRLHGVDCCASEEEYRIFRDSEIKRFELSVDTLWKYLKVYLELKFGVIQSSPKTVFRECLRVQLIKDEKEVLLALKMVDARNMTSHMYKEELAEQMHGQTPMYYALMERLITLAKPN
jgi:nucleotidyltransferase substrate binding protein (TIGR01987 family)